MSNTSIIFPHVACHLLGVIFCSMLYGATLMQTGYYFHSFPKDSCRLKTVVASLSTLGTAQMVLVIVSIYQYTIVWRDNIVQLSDATPSFTASMSVSCLVAFGVQLAYAHRVWRLSFHNWLLTLPIVVLAFIAVGFNIALVVESAENPVWASTSGNNLVVLVSSISSALCDFLIAGSQVYLLHRSRAVGRLRSVITRLTIVVVNAGLLTSIDVTVFLILFLVCPGNGGFLIPYILLSQVYLNSFLAVLNSRRLLREMVDSEEFSYSDNIASSLREFRIRPLTQTDTIHASLAPSRHQTLSEPHPQLHKPNSYPSGVCSCPNIVVSRV